MKIIQIPSHAIQDALQRLGRYAAIAWGFSHLEPRPNKDSWGSATSQNEQSNSGMRSFWIVFYDNCGYCDLLWGLPIVGFLLVPLIQRGSKH